MNLMTLMMFNKVKQSIVNKLIIIKKTDYRLSINTKVNLESIESIMTVNELKQKRNVNNPAKNFHTLEINTSQKELTTT
jgi:hypothetical protein